MDNENTNERERLLAELTAAIRQEMRLALAWNDTAAAFAGLHPTDATILFFLYEHGSATAAQVGVVAGLTTGATTAALNRLERANFIYREVDERDRRRVIIRTKQLPSPFKTIRQVTEAELQASLGGKSNASIQSLIAHREQTNAMLTRIIERLTKPSP
ncbi:MAG TPA: helix-turn-helix domain-containing protein [Candidatus Saccharimonadia bacterium]|nr:helix-turn-helix domain-containing protein [Candidatus Saccharimonadia bacterium]